MFIQKDVFNVKKDIAKFVGSKVKLQSNISKHKSLVSEGVIENTYPSIFIIQLYEGIIPLRKVSFSYTDVLTHAIEITLL